MDLRQSFGTNQQAEKEGVWIPLSETTAILVARATNPEFKKVLRRLMAPHKIAVRQDTLGEDVAEPLFIQAMAKAVLLDWRELALDGEAIAYSEANARRLLTELPDFRNFVWETASDAATFREAEMEAAEGNSEPTPHGASSGARKSQSSSPE
jgi:hypothetical protein